MPRPTREYIRREFMIQFAHATPEVRKGTLEALHVLDEAVLAQNAPLPTGEEPLIADQTTGDESGV